MDSLNQGANFSGDSPTPGIQQQADQSSQTVSTPTGQNGADFGFTFDPSVFQQQQVNPQAQQGTGPAGFQSTGVQTDSELVQAGGDPTKIARIWQSRHDKAQAKVMELEQRAQKLSEYERFVMELESDPAVRRAVFHQLDPELFQSSVQDIDSLVVADLKKEFGEDFQADPSKRDMPGPDRRYFKRMDELYSKYETTSKTQVQTLKEIREAKLQAKQKEDVQHQETYNKILQMAQGNSKVVDYFFQWIPKADPAVLFSMFLMGLRQNTQRPAPGLITQPGVAPQGVTGSQELQAFVNRYKLS